MRSFVIAGERLRASCWTDRHAALIGDEARGQETPTMYSSFDDAVGELRRVMPELRARLEQLIAEATDSD
jgi:hypothetical protein